MRECVLARLLSENVKQNKKISEEMWMRALLNRILELLEVPVH